MELINFLSLIGITEIENVDWPVFEDDYIKFMSWGGETDVMQADKFESWLKENNFGYSKLSERSFGISLEACDYIESLYN